MEEYNHFDELVAKAMAVGDSKTKLKKRLLEAKALLNTGYKEKFRDGNFNFAKKQLVGDGCVLQWKLRLHPSKEESYENQQTSCGTVILINGHCGQHS